MVPGIEYYLELLTVETVSEIVPDNLYQELDALADAPRIRQVLIL